MTAPRPDLDAPMRRQLARFHAAIAAGMPRVGWKICINDPRTQSRLGIDAPLIGPLNGSRVFASGDAYPVRSDARLACEPEIAIAIGGDGMLESLDGARAAIAALAPALELVNYGRLSPELAIVVETASFHDGVVLGAARPPASMPTLGPGCPRFTCNGTEAGRVDPTLVPADLAVIVQHVATFLARYGEALLPGDWILSGACAAAIPARVGDVVGADFGATLGAVAVTIG